MIDITKSFLSQAEFVSLPAHQREKLRETFSIAKSGQTKVQTTPNGNDRLVSDGTESEDLRNSLNLEAILKFLGREAKKGDIFDFNLLFQEVMNKLFPSEPVKVIAPKEVPIAPIPAGNEEKKAEGEKKIVVSQKKKGRPKKNG